MVKKYEITIFFAVPFLLQTLIEKKTTLNNIRIVNFYGGVIDHFNLNKIQQVFKKAILIYSYGLTEASPRVSFIKGKDLTSQIGSSGKAINNVEISIRDDDSNEIPRNEIGEIHVKGPNVMMGYYKNENLTKITLKNGYLHTGDLGYMDYKGFLYVTGRKDSMFKISGKNIYPEEIENIILRYPGIKDSLVTSLNENDFHFIQAYVVCDEQINISNIKQFCKENLPDYKVPRKFYIVDQIPKTASGKTIRKGVFTNGEQHFRKDS